MQTPIQLQTPQSTMVSCLQHRLEQRLQKAGGITNQYLIGLKAYSMRWNPFLMLLELSRT